jgi:hypothetical protein
MATLPVLNSGNNYNAGYEEGAPNSINAPTNRNTGRGIVPQGQESHHDIPWANRRDAANAGINVNDHRTNLPEPFHQSINYQYGQDWNSFFRGGSRTYSEIMSFKEEMRQKYGY